MGGTLPLDKPFPSAGDPRRDGREFVGDEKHGRGPWGDLGDASQHAQPPLVNAENRGVDSHAVRRSRRDAQRTMPMQRVALEYFGPSHAASLNRSKTRGFTKTYVLFLKVSELGLQQNGFFEPMARFE